MLLERDYVLLYGPKVRTEDGIKHRNKVLQPCGCWSADVWREVEFRGSTRKQWCQETRQCGVHSAAAIVLQLQMGVRMHGDVFVAKLGDGAKRLLAESELVLHSANMINQEMKALEVVGHAPARKLVDGMLSKRHWRSRNKDRR